ncbi:exocyst complex component Sec6 [Ancylostoma duodenale]|uniref:Exocyst complex component Sec6 n=1 Tax=Ancylostoma duodenale TaxID=51022 RepID=A0A0C2DC40_9BILA|nr:exocyst complex component Sec6 [Ancylostoma duodenale]
MGQAVIGPSLSSIIPMVMMDDADLERLYEQWEENDDEKLDDDELPEHKRSPNTMDLDSIKAKAKNPEELLSMTKKGQTLMMFVNIRDPSNPLEKNRPFTSKYTEIFQSMLRNNHIICQVFLIDDDRAIFMFNDGSQAFEAKNFLLKQIQVSLEGQQYVGAGAAKKDELYVLTTNNICLDFWFTWFIHANKIWLQRAMEENGYEAALEQIASLLQRPDQLEKLPEMRKRADRKKAAVEAMLRTGVQSQLEGIRTAIAHLHTAAEDISAIETGLVRFLRIAAIRHRLTPFPQLREKMRELRDANARHGQYAAAMENLKHIFNINQTIHDTKVALDQGKLLAAHKNIMDLELARDELLLEVHKSNSSNKDYEINLLITFFIKVDELVTDLSSNMWFVVGRALEMVKGSETGSGPQELVSCIRIVEREERIDNYYLEKKSRGSAFMPPGRPRQWRKKAFEVLEKTVWSRVEGNQLEDRGLNKAWLARYLEVCRKVIVDDLQLARAAVPCFPPDYQIYDRFVHMYHNCVCKRLREIAAERLEKSELVQLLSWIQTYGGEELLGNRRLQINAAALLEDVPVLSRTTLNSLYDSFVEMTRNDMKIWLEKTLSAEKDDWNKHVRPDEDNFGYFYTSLPNILFGMLRDTIPCRYLVGEGV